jgi:hypothetical protein
MSREAMQMALEALERYGGVDQRACDAEEALRQALETEQEPVATVTSESGNPNLSMSWWHEPALPVGTKIYTSPQPNKQWVGLTDQEINSVCYKRDWTAPWTNTTFARAIEAKLREKNGGEYRNGATTERTKLSQENT